MHKGVVAVLWVLLLIDLPTLVSAAELQVDSTQTSMSSSPATMAPCATAAAAAAAVIPGTTVVLNESAQAAAADGVSPDCDETASAAASATAGVIVAPTMGDSIGDQLTLCAVVSVGAAVNATGLASASAAVGGESAETQPILVQVVRPGVSAPVVAVPPNLLQTAGGPNARGFACASEFTGLIGDSILLSIGGNAVARITGVGQSAAASADALELSIGACPAELERCPRQFGLAAPAASTPAMAVIAALFAILGWFGVRRRIAS